jgi:DNA-binding transcriptional LysR family regulator
MTLDVPDHDRGMERSHRLAQFWNWLIVFRVVAETEHVGTAARHLRVSPSAVSRTVSLLEDELGQALFERQGRRIRLSPLGHELLPYVRDAMRIVDDGVLRVTGREVRGRLRVSLPEFLAGLGVLALRRLQALHPELELHLVHLEDERVVKRLLNGELDVAVQAAPVSERALEVRPLVEMKNRLYVSASHALAGRRRVTLEEVAQHGFVVSDVRRDGWPVDRRRAERLRVARVEAEIEACRHGLIAALPAHCAEPYVASRDIVALRAAALEPTTYFAVCRRAVTEMSTTQRVIDALATGLQPTARASTREGPRRRKRVAR